MVYFECVDLMLLENFLRHKLMLCVALCIVLNSPVHSNAVINYAIEQCCVIGPKTFPATIVNFIFDMSQYCVGVVYPQPMGSR